MLDGFIQPGVTTMAINNWVEDFIVNELHSARPVKGSMTFRMC
jgi:methionyl aminopeptidase